MPTFICLLRGVNVSGKNLIRMAELRNAMAALGFQRVVTYVQSGNIVFDAKGKADALGVKIAAAITADFGCAVPVVMRSAEELTAVTRGNPFLKEKGIDPSKLHVTFLAAPPTKDGLARLTAISAGADRARAIGREVYLHCPRGYGETKLSNAALERALGIGATTRNWKTTTTLAEMATAKDRLCQA
jgi:uncharacterized protein (DUF1697 family)